MLEIKNIRRTYKNGPSEIRALDDVTNQFNAGEVVFILGESGSGKSTLLNVMSGLDVDIKGHIEIDGLNTDSFSKRDWAIYRNYYVGFIFQEFNLIEHLNITDNVALPLLFQGVSKKEARSKAILELEKIGLKDKVKKYPKQLSGGQQQRVAIARALVTNPGVIMADEPTGALDQKLGHKVMQYLIKNATDKVVVIVTHDEELALEYGTRILRLEDGKVIEDKTNVPSFLADLKDESTPSQKESITLKQPKMSMGMTLKFARNNVTSRMFRTFFTSSIVSIGFIAVFLLTFLIYGINNSISDSINSILPKNQYQVASILSNDLTEDDLDTVLMYDGVASARLDLSIYTSISRISSFDTYIQSTILNPLPYDLSEINTNRLFGRLPENETEILISNVAAADLQEVNASTNESDNQYLFDLIGGEEISLVWETWDPEKEEVIMIEKIYTVVGITTETVSIIGFSQSNVYVEYNEFLDVYEEYVQKVDEVEDSTISSSTILVYFEEDTSEETITSMKESLRDNHELILNNNFENATAGINDFFNNSLKWFVGLASISFIVSGILIGLVVYTSVLERFKEIGILTAVGARSGNILSIFLVESGLIGLMSSLIGLLIAYLISRLLNSIFSTIILDTLSLITNNDIRFTLLEVNWIVVLIGLLFSVVYAVIAGILPALSATRMNTIKALRRE
jgi:putative ABC transport system permease protein